jgi:hypothetical protein
MVTKTLVQASLMAELLPLARQTAPVIPKIFPMHVAGGLCAGVAVAWPFDQDKRGPGHDLAIYPGPPAVTVACGRAVQQSLYACSPRCCPAPGGRARGRCRMRFGSSIADGAGGEPVCATRVTAGRSIAGRTVPSSVGRGICG